MLGGRLDLRERLASGSRASARGHAVVTGPAGALVVVRWKSARGDVHALLNVGDDADVIDRAARFLEGADSTNGELATGIMRAMRVLVRRRAAAAAAGGRNAAGRRLRRRILASARRAAADRDRTLLHLLDTALVRVSAGLSVGAERALSDAFDSCARHSLRAWIRTYPARHPGLCDPEVEAVLVGDGTG
jgi:hypothetical protein